VDLPTVTEVSVMAVAEAHGLPESRTRPLPESVAGDVNGRSPPAWAGNRHGGMRVLEVGVAMPAREANGVATGLVAQSCVGRLGISIIRCNERAADHGGDAARSVTRSLAASLHHCRWRPQLKRRAHRACGHGRYKRACTRDFNEIKAIGDAGSTTRTAVAIHQRLDDGQVERKQSAATRWR
jgi:hypothetical protein